MKDSNPISLFSFQDIITCLTGIMIVIVLVILLQLVDALTKATQSSPLETVYKELQAECDLLREREKELSARLKKLRKESKKQKDIPESELVKNIRREERYMKILAGELNQSEEELKKVKEEQSKLAEQLKAEEEKSENNKQRDTNISQILAETERLKQEERRIYQEFEKKRKMIRFTFSGMNNLTPVLIECCGWGFRTKVHPNGNCRVFGTKGTSGIAAQLKNLNSYIREFKKDNIYLVFFFREETFPMVGTITFTFECDGYKIGKEVLEKGEECIDG